MTIVDSGVWIDYFGGRSSLEARWLESAVGRDVVGLTDLILCEVLQGVRDERVADALGRDLLLKFPVLSNGGVEIAVAAATNYRVLRRRGRTVRNAIDCLIATFCLLHGHTLLHHDRDFDAFEQELGLLVLHPDA